MAQALKNEISHFNPRRSVIVVLIVIIATHLLTLLLPDDPADFGPASMIPAAFLLVYIFATRRILEALALASLTGFIMVSRPVSAGGGSWFSNTLTDLNDSLLSVMMSEDIAWLIIVCGLMGSIIALIEKAGGSYAFGEWLASKAKTRKSALLFTWLLGVLVFIDDYLNSLTVGACMSPLTDKHRVPREMLSYIVDSTAAPLCVLIPISTWAVFCSRILESNGLGDGMVFFVKTIPYNFYGWAAALIVPLVIIGVIPLFGPMKDAERRVKDGGPLAPSGSEKIDIRTGSEMGDIPDNPKTRNLFVPILIIVFASIIFGLSTENGKVVIDVDMQTGVIITLIFMFFWYGWQKIVTPSEFADVTIQGLKNMILPLTLMVLAFLFAEVNDQIHFTYYVITTATEYLSPQLLPVVVFLVLSVTEFITGTNWGMYIIALPIVIPLAMNLDANMVLAVSAVLSAGVFGSHICFYSDATVITSAATGCDNFRHAVSQAPYGFLGAGISAIAFLVAGFVL